MRLPLQPANSLSTTLSPASSSLPPLYFIDNEPFIIELQGALELPPAFHNHSIDNHNDMHGLLVGKIDFSEPQKPILQIAHHRLEGKLITLPDPYALLRSTSAPPSSIPEPDLPALEENGPSSAKKLKLSSSPEKPKERSALVDDKIEPKIEIVALVRRKIVFSKRPEPIIVLSSEAG